MKTVENAATPPKPNASLVIRQNFRVKVKPT